MNLPEIANSDLMPSDIPSAGAEWREIKRFAKTFDAYKRWGSIEACMDIVDDPHRRESLDELRTCLFIEYRAWNHIGRRPNDESIARARELIDQIRTKVAAGILE